MLAQRSVSYFICFLLACITARGQEAGQKDTPFWQLPTASVNLKSLSPANVKLVAVPNSQRGFILLQTGEAAPVADFVPATEELKPFLPAKDSGYKVIPKGLNVGAVTFGDRNYKIEKLPDAFKGLTLLQTKAGHKAIVDSTYSIVLSAEKPCLVFVALDQRVIETYTQHGTPAWLQEYAPTEERIKTDDPIMGQTDAEFLVFVRKSAGGRIVLGPPSMDISMNSMYFAFFGQE